MRNERQSLILEIIAGQDIGTQEELLHCLRERGVSCTQATVSRDMRRLRLVKEQTGPGAYRYRAGTELPRNVEARLRTIFRESVVSLETAQNLVVLKTMPGTANAACAAMDRMDIPGMAGSLAGDDTAFVAMKDAASAEALCAQLREMLKGESV